MNTTPGFLIERMKSGTKTRFLAYGSSNTQRRIFGVHWFDCLELAIIGTYGRGLGTFINTGIGGDTSRGLLDRFDEDAAFYRPQLAFITIGGNDSFNSATNGIDEGVFEANLKELHDRFGGMGTKVVFQTYYSYDKERVDPELFIAFLRYMDIVREVAADTGAYLIDHLKRWEALRLNRPDLYGPLMADPAHVRSTGNLVIGLDIARHFMAFPNDVDSGPWQEALGIQRLMDRLTN